MQKMQSKVFFRAAAVSGETRFVRPLAPSSPLLRNSFRSIVSNSVRPRIRGRFLNGPPVDPCVSQRKSLPTFVTLFDATSVVVVADTSPPPLSLFLSHTKYLKNRGIGLEETRRIYMLVRISRGRSESTLRAESFGGWHRPRAEAALFSVLLPALRETEGAQHRLYRHEGRVRDSRFHRYAATTRQRRWKYRRA